MAVLGILECKKRKEIILIVSDDSGEFLRNRKHKQSYTITSDQCKKNAPPGNSKAKWQWKITILSLSDFLSLGWDSKKKPLQELCREQEYCFDMSMLSLNLSDMGKDLPGYDPLDTPKKIGVIPEEDCIEICI